MKIILKLLLPLWALVCVQNAGAQEPPLATRLEDHVYYLAADSMYGRLAGSEHAIKAAQYIVGMLRGAGVPGIDGGEGYVHSFLYTRWATNQELQYHNVVGMIRSENPDLCHEYIVVGAHYDHLGFLRRWGKNEIYNGADDNASGVAVLIELARKLQTEKHKLGRSVIVVGFDAEEIGLAGSTHFIDDLREPSIDKLKLMVSMDMVGWLKGRPLTYYGAATLNDAGAAVLGNTALVPEGLEVKLHDLEKGPGATDTKPFAVKGIPTLHVTTGRRSPYHLPTDDAKLIDYEGMALVTEHLFNVVVAMSAESGLGGSGRIARKHKEDIGMY